MGHARFSSDEIVRRGEEIYAQRLRDKVETDGNMGKIIVIDIETGDYVIDEDALRASHDLQAKHPGAALYAERIGYDAVYDFAGGPRRVKR